MSPVEIAKDWWAATTLKRITVISVAISSSIAAIFAVLHFGQVEEPYWFATRGMVRELIAEAQNSSQVRDAANARRIISVEIAVKESERRNIQGQIDRIEVEIKKLPTSGSDSLRDVLVEQFRRYTDQIKSLDFQLDELRRKQSAGRP